MIYLAPVVPQLAAKTRELFQEDNWCWDSAQQPLLASTVKPFKPLLTRVEAEQVDKMVEQSKGSNMKPAVANEVSENNEKVA